MVKVISLHGFALIAALSAAPITRAPAQNAPVLTLQPTNQTVKDGTSLVLVAAVSGDGPLSYQWRFNGTNLPNLITSVAGTGSPGFSGDVGPATDASLYYPVALAFDPGGDLLIADTYNSRVRKVDTNGLITTIAGNGPDFILGGSNGDGGPATNATLYSPVGIACDAQGNLFIADGQIRKVDANGIINTVAGNGSIGFSGDGGPATNAALRGADAVAVDSAGDLFIADTMNGRVRKVSPDGIITTIAGNGIPIGGLGGAAATNAPIGYPCDVTLDGAGNLFIVNGFQDDIFEVDTNGVITLFAGTGVSGYSGDGGPAVNADLGIGYDALGLPSHTAVDIFGNVFIADTLNNRVRKVDAQGLITTVAGNGSPSYFGDGGAAVNASLLRPQAVAVDRSGNLFVADSGNEHIREVVAFGPALAIPNPGVLEAGNYDVVVTGPFGSVTSSVAVLTVLGPPQIEQEPLNQVILAGGGASFSVLAAGTAPLSYQWYLGGAALAGQTNATARIPNIGASNAGGYTVVIANAYGSVTSAPAALSIDFPPSIISPPVSESALPGASVLLGVTAAGTGPLAYQWRLDGMNLPGIFIVAGGGIDAPGNGGPATSSSLVQPYGVARDLLRDLFISDSFANCVRKVDSKGIITTIAGIGREGFAGDGGPAAMAQLSNPSGLAADALGNLYIADTGNNRIRKINSRGIITTLAGNGVATMAGDGGPATNASLYSPAGVTVDSTGNVFLADTYNQRIRKVSPFGVITTVAGDGGGGYSGDGGSPIGAELNYPAAVAVDAAGNLYIAETGRQGSSGSRIRKVSPLGIITTFAGNGADAHSGDGGPATQASLNFPCGIALDASGNLFIADTDNQRIRKIDTNGIITTVAGGGTSGLGGAATNAALSYPSGVAVDSAGNLFVADSAAASVLQVVTYGPTLALYTAGMDNSGSYDVVVTSPFGSVTSSVAGLALRAPGSLSATRVNENEVVLQSNVVPGQSYSLLSTAGLNPPVRWQNLSTFTADITGTWSITNSFSPSQPTLFYRFVPTVLVNQ